MTTVATSWTPGAACATRPDLPWTADGPLTSDQRDAMTGVCAECPVRAACGDLAAQITATAGWWAGTDHDTDRTHPWHITTAPAPAWAQPTLDGLDGWAA